jgi:hypothetical protein
MSTTTNKQMIEQIAEIAHGTVRAMGIASGNVDIPTWQILPSAQKELFRRAIEHAACETCANASDPLTERLARMGYEHQKRISEPTESGGTSASVEWNGLSEGKRMEWRLLVAVTRVFTMSHTIGAVPQRAVAA